MEPAKKAQQISSGFGRSKNESPKPDGPSDAAIVGRVLRGDIDAYRLLIEKYQNALLACAWQHLQTREDAEEAAQEAFVIGFERLKKLREPKYFFTWLWRICANVSIKMHRKARRRQVGLVGEIGAAEEQLGGIELDERKREILQALAMLPEDQRTALTLRFWEGMAYGDMAKLLGLSHDALYQRVSRGLKSLREILGDEFQEEI